MTIPFYTQAISSLKPGCSWRLVGDDNVENLEWNNENELPPPTQEEIIEEAARLQVEYDAKEYQRQRVPEYGNWKDQLNLLYDDIKSGNLENGKWVQMIEEVKARHPKPE